MLTKTHLAILVAAALASMLWTVAFGQSNEPGSHTSASASAGAAANAKRS